MVRFSTLSLVNGVLVENEVREIKQSTIQQCPHYILVPSHYRDDGTCKCNDPNEKVMKEWGYRWRNGQWR